MGIIKNKNNQIRSGWKIAIVIIAYFIVQGVISIITGLVIGAMIESSNKGGVNSQQMAGLISQFISNNPIVRLVFQGMDFLSLMIVTYLTLRLFDKKRFKDIGLTGLSSNFKDFGYGLLLGAVSISVIFFILLLTGNITLENSLAEPQFSFLTVIGLIAFIFVGIKEEVLTRGYCITMLNQMGRPWLSVIISSLLFSSLHVFNPNVRLFGLINIVLVGILFGYMYLKSRNLWMPIGYHITWNYFQGDVFGLPVSGGTHKGIYNVSTFKDNLLTGGSFGPEAGVLATIIIISGLILVWRMPGKHYTRDDR